VQINGEAGHKLLSPFIAVIPVSPFKY